MNSILTKEQICEFQKTVLDYYEQNPRQFRWRQTTDPYEITVSEIMLQQTQTERVVTKYNEWLSVFPNAFVLANADFASVLQRWSGLGYNRRARFLQETCKTVCQKYAGVFPYSVQELEELPGIGAYTARAIATFAFGSPEVFIETNIRSVYLFFFFADCTQKVNDTQILPLIEQTLYRKNPRMWYYALMDYGAALKKKTSNPNKKSAHYTKQSKFEGSLRQARGAILRQLTLVQEITLEHVSKTESVDYEKLQKAAESLVTEKFIYKENDVYKIQNN